ncbi:hypothetical protein GGF50DRAFT_63716 [Schizophyllum commune]
MRRSSRISARTTTVKDDSARVAACGPAPSPSLNQPSCKRRKTSQQTQASSSTTKSLKTLYGARRKGKLAALSEMPVDIIYEICSKLHPRDLLQVSRTTKIWRDMLMNKKRSEGIWRNSYIGTEGLPPLPEDIPIPKFVGLLFDRLCHFCNASVSRNIIWIARVRACNKCLQNLTFHLRSSSPHSEHRNGRGRWVDILGYLSYSKCVTAFRRTGYDRVYPAALVAAYMADYKSDSVHTLNEEEQLRWCENRAKEADALIQHSTLCEAWEEEHQLDRSSELQRLREERYTEIVRRLTELGFGDEIQKAGDGFLNHKLVKKPQRLSEKGTNIKDPLISYLQDLKTNRIRRERDGVIDTRKRLVSDLYKKYLSTQPFTAILPCVGEILTHPEISRLVKGTPLDHEVTKDTLRVALERIPESYYSSWRARCDDALVEILGANAPATRADLLLATTAFDLNEELTMDTLSYPHVLVASIITGAYNGLHNPRSRPWSADGLCVARGYRAIAEQVITLVGLNPKTTTAQEMDEQGAWFLWTGEAKGKAAQKLAVNWRGACRLEHYANCQSAKKLRIKLLTPKDTESVRDKYARDVYQGGALAEKVQCVRCEARLEGGSAMRSHLAKWHNISTPTRADYVLSPQVEGGVGIYKWPLMSDEDDGQGSLFRVYNFKGLY